MEKLIHLLVDAEMKRFAGVKTPIVFLQNVVTDLLLGLKAHEALRIFDEYVRQRYHVLPGFITMNMPMLVNALEKVGIENSIVCANINKIGFRMSGGIDAYRALLRSRRCKAIA